MMDKGSIHFTIDVFIEFYVYSSQEQFQMKNCITLFVRRVDEDHSSHLGVVEAGSDECADG